MPKTDKNFVMPKFGKFKSNKEVITELRENFKLLKELNKDDPSFEVVTIENRTKELLRVLGERVSFPYYEKPAGK